MELKTIEFERIPMGIEKLDALGFKGVITCDSVNSLVSKFSELNSLATKTLKDSGVRAPTQLVESRDFKNSSLYEIQIFEFVEGWFGISFSRDRDYKEILINIEVSRSILDYDSSPSVRFREDLSIPEGEIKIYENLFTELVKKVNRMAK